MPLLRALSRAFLIRRLLGGGSRRHRGRGYGYGYGRRRSSGGGFGRMGPFPSYSRRTRGGSRVTVSGCCLPIPLALTVGATAVAAKAVRSR